MNSDLLNTHLMDMAETLLDENHRLSIRMRGFSMYPTFREGDVGVVEKCASDKIAVGDIVVFKATNKLVAHRLIAITSQQGVPLFITKGDNNSHRDQPFGTDALVGKITSFQRNGKEKTLNSVQMKWRRFASLYFPRLTLLENRMIFKIRHHTKKIHNEWQSIMRNLRVVSPHSGWELWLNVIIAVLQGILPFVIIVCIKKLIDSLTQSSSIGDSLHFHFLLLLIFTALVFLLNGVLAEARGFYFEKLTQTITRRIYKMLHAKHVGLDMSHYENPNEQDKIHRAVQEASFRPVKIINELLTTVKSVAAALFMVVLFISIKWYLVVLLVIAIIPGVIVKLRFSGKLYKQKVAHSTEEREMYYFNRILTGFPFAKELKLFGFASYFLRRFYDTQDTLFEQKLSIRKTELKYDIWAQLFAILLIFFLLGYVAFLKIQGEISIGTVVLFFFAFQRGYSVLNDFFRSLTQIVEDNTYLNDFVAFLNMPTQSEEKSLIPFPSPLSQGIVVDNVTFRYELSQREALKSAKIIIPKGKTVAFVGANGSGKTTMIKLLCGFYRPDSGAVLFDGVDLSSIGQKAVCENITAVFQDFALYNISALHNLALGDIRTEVDLARAKEAARKAGIAEVIERLPNGYNTLLGNLFKGGEELSIGQWQKMAIARAFYRDSPILLMDEPSSALDAESEAQILQSLKMLAQDKTVVIISHRLSTVQWAEIIYFFENGEIIESGNHEELMRLKGKYFSMFNKC
jgi:ATP-binding cassette, subfamily B, bacterial